MNTVSPSLQLLCVCVVGEGKEREIQQAPWLFQAARNNTLTPQHGTKRASKQTSCAGGVFLHFLAECSGGSLDQECASERTYVSVLKFLKQVDSNVITYYCFFALFRFLFWGGSFLFYFVFPSDLYQELK